MNKKKNDNDKWTPIYQDHTDQCYMMHAFDVDNKKDFTIDHIKDLKHVTHTLSMHFTPSVISQFHLYSGSHISNCGLCAMSMGFQENNTNHNTFLSSIY